MSNAGATRVRAKHWVFTVNNYGDEDCSQFEDLKEFATYYVYGKEISDSGTEHLQCYFAFKKTIYLTQLKRYWPRGHFEVMQTKRPEIAANYCKKGEQSHEEWSKLGTKGPNFGKNAEWTEFGEISESQAAAGNRENKNIWIEARENAMQGNFEKIPPHILIPNYGSFKKFHFDHQPRPEDLDDCCGEWIWGPPGVGKSYTARIENPSYYDKMLNKWWDQYDGEDCILLDDFEIDHSMFGHFLKRWADRYSFTAEVKNHIMQLRPKKILVTSNHHPKDIWTGTMLEAILRRFKIREIQVLEKFDRVKLKTGKKQKRKAFVSPVSPYVAKKFKDVNGKIVLNKASSAIKRIDDYKAGTWDTQTVDAWADGIRPDDSGCTTTESVSNESDSLDSNTNSF